MISLEIIYSLRNIIFDIFGNNVLRKGEVIFIECQYARYIYIISISTYRDTHIHMHKYHLSDIIILEVSLRGIKIEVNEWLLEFGFTKP